MTSLFIYISYNIKAKSNPRMCVCICVSLCLCVCVCALVCVYHCQWRNLYSPCTCWHHEFETTGLTWFRFWGILSQYLTLTYTMSICLRKELQGQKLTSTYLPGRLIHEYIPYIQNSVNFLWNSSHGGCLGKLCKWIAVWTIQSSNQWRRYLVAGVLEVL